MPAHGRRCAPTRPHEQALRAARSALTLAKQDELAAGQEFNQASQKAKCDSISASVIAFCGVGNTLIADAAITECAGSSCVKAADTQTCCLIVPKPEMMEDDAPQTVDDGMSETTVRRRPPRTMVDTMCEGMCHPHRPLSATRRCVMPVKDQPSINCWPARSTPQMVIIVGAVVLVILAGIGLTTYSMKKKQQAQPDVAVIPLRGFVPGGRREGPWSRR